MKALKNSFSAQVADASVFAGEFIPLAVAIAESGRSLETADVISPAQGFCASISNKPVLLANALFLKWQRLWRENCTLKHKPGRRRSHGRLQMSQFQNGI